MPRVSSVFHLLSVSLLCLTPSHAFVGLTRGRFAWMREAEKKHGRAALLALPTLAVLSATTNGDDPVRWLNAQPVDVQLTCYSVAAALESFNFPRFGSAKPFTLKPEEVPGKLLPGGLPSRALDHVEDAAGRAAMLAVAGVLAVSSAAGRLG